MTTYLGTQLKGKYWALHSIVGESITPHIKIRTAISQSDLTKLYLFYNLSSRNKLKLYNALVCSALIYSPGIMNRISKSPLLSMQRIQNKALRFIRNTRWDDYRTSQSLHHQLNIPPINIAIDNQARAMWQKFQINLPHIHRELVDNHPPITINSRFHSSRLRAEQPQPPPIYC